MIKVALISVVALQGLLYAIQNVVNLDACYAAVAYALRMAEHTVYTASFGPAIENSILVWTAIALIIAGELSVGLVAATGAWQLWAARKRSSSDFNAAKGTGILGCGIAMLVWFGLFGALGGAYFQMWQTSAGALSLEGAFQYAGSSALIALYVAVAND
jgi:predicted small integral membrane protein